MHSARQDLEIFFDITGELPANMYDSQIAATLLGFGDQIGYANLLNDMLGVKLEKLHTRTDWSKRPLDEGQVQYALDDVRYLIEIYRQQKNKLQENGREHWLADDFNYLSNKGLYSSITAGSWQRVRGSNSLKGVQLAVLQNLAEWREELARHINRPKQWIIRDEALVEISRRLPIDQNSLEAIRGWYIVFAKHTEQILAIIQGAKNIPKDQWPTQPKRVSLSKVQEAIVDVLMAIVRLKAAENSVTASVLVNRKQLEKLVSGDYDCLVLKGWRKEIVGNELIAMLENNRMVSVKQGQLMLDAKT
jgi:ribonuclease D